MLDGIKARHGRRRKGWKGTLWMNNCGNIACGNEVGIKARRGMEYKNGPSTYNWGILRRCMQKLPRCCEGTFVLLVCL